MIYEAVPLLGASSSTTPAQAPRDPQLQGAPRIRGDLTAHAKEPGLFHGRQGVAEEGDVEQLQDYI